MSLFRKKSGKPIVFESTLCLRCVYACSFVEKTWIVFHFEMEYPLKIIPKLPIMTISYAGLPGKRCSACSGLLFGRIGNVLRCATCQPPLDGETFEEWLEARYTAGVLRWGVSLPPSPPVDPDAFLFVSEDLDWVESEPCDKTAMVCHVGPMKTGRWFIRLDRELFSWLAAKAYRNEKARFREDFEEALRLLREIAARAIEVHVLPDSFSDESRWPRASNQPNPYDLLPDLRQIEFPGFR